MSNTDEISEVVRAIPLDLDLIIAESTWTSNFGVEGRAAVDADVRLWARDLLTEALKANGVRGYAK